MFPARYDCQTLSKGDALGNIIGNGIFLYAKGISKLTVQPFLRLAEIAFISGSIMLFVLYTDFVAVMQTFYHLGNLAAVTGLQGLAAAAFPLFGIRPSAMGLRTRSSGRCASQCRRNLRFGAFLAGDRVRD